MELMEKLHLLPSKDYSYKHPDHLSRFDLKDLPPEVSEALDPRSSSHCFTLRPDQKPLTVAQYRAIKKLGDSGQGPAVCQSKMIISFKDIRNQIVCQGLPLLDIACRQARQSCLTCPAYNGKDPKVQKAKQEWYDRLLKDSR